MNLKWKLGVLFLLSALVMLWPASAKRNSAAQEESLITRTTTASIAIRDLSTRCAWAFAISNGNSHDTGTKAPVAKNVTAAIRPQRINR